MRKYPRSICQSYLSWKRNLVQIISKRKSMNGIGYLTRPFQSMLVYSQVFICDRILASDSRRRRGNFVNLAFPGCFSVIREDA